ncbi:MAG TPA: hypothetical protein VJP77_07410, partial [Planctomycetota bacterium]|nr:hypothetical protein [Planctomycetota bacterium]
AEPGRRYYRLDVSTGLVALGRAERRRERFAEAEAAFAESLAVVDDLLRDFPDSARYRRRRIEVLDELALCAGLQGQHAQAFDRYEASLAEKEALCREAPERCDLAYEAAATLVNLSNTLVQRVEGLEQALGFLERAERHLLVCDRQVPPLAYVVAMQGNARYLHALALCLLDRPPEAREAIERFGAADAAGALPLRQTADLWNEWVLALRRAEPDAVARAEQEALGRRRMLDALRQALEAGYADLDELSHTPALDSFRADPEFVALLATLQPGG